jgi:hypothetical protein
LRVAAAFLPSPQFPPAQYPLRYGSAPAYPHFNDIPSVHSALLVLPD